MIVRVSVGFIGITPEDVNDDLKLALQKGIANVLDVWWEKLSTPIITPYGDERRRRRLSVNRMIPAPSLRTANSASYDGDGDGDGDGEHVTRRLSSGITATVDIQTNDEENAAVYAGVVGSRMEDALEDGSLMTAFVTQAAALDSSYSTSLANVTADAESFSIIDASPTPSPTTIPVYDPGVITEATVYTLFSVVTILALSVVFFVLHHYGVKIPIFSDLLHKYSHHHRKVGPEPTGEKEEEGSDNTNDEGSDKDRIRRFKLPKMRDNKVAPDKDMGDVDLEIGSPASRKTDNLRGPESIKEENEEEDSGREEEEEEKDNESEEAYTGPTALQTLQSLWQAHGQDVPPAVAFRLRDPDSELGSYDDDDDAEMMSTFNSSLLPVPLDEIDWKNSIVFPGDFSAFDDDYIMLLLNAISHEHENRLAAVDGDEEKIKDVEDSAVFEVSTVTMTGSTLSVHDVITRVLKVYSDPALEHVDMNHAIFTVTKNAPRFDQKAAFMPGATFICGASTFEKVLNSRDHHPSQAKFGNEDALQVSLDAIRGQGCHFVVGEGRDKNMRGHEVLEAMSPALPPSMRKIFEFVVDEEDSEDEEDEDETEDEDEDEEEEEGNNSSDDEVEEEEEDVDDAASQKGSDDDED